MEIWEPIFHTTLEKLNRKEINFETYMKFNLAHVFETVYGIIWYFNNQLSEKFKFQLIEFFIRLKLYTYETSKVGLASMIEYLEKYPSA